MSAITWKEDSKHHENIRWLRWDSMHHAYMDDTIVAFVVARERRDDEGEWFQEIRCYWDDPESPWQFADDLDQAMRFVERKFLVCADTGAAA